MKIYLIVSIISLLFIQGCGFKKIDRSKYVNFDLSEIKCLEINRLILN